MINGVAIPSRASFTERCISAAFKKAHRMPLGPFVAPDALTLAERNVRVARLALYVFIVLALVVILLASLYAPDKFPDVFIAIGAGVLAILASILAVIQVEMAYYQMKQVANVKKTTPPPHR
jgi:hypothetical protein